MPIPIKQLASLMASNEERFSGPEYVRGESANFLVIEDQPDELKEILERLVLCQPGRLFILRSQPEISRESGDALNPEITAELTADLTAELKIAQHRISNESLLWNEEIIISANVKEAWSRIPSILRSFIISSAPLYAILPSKNELLLFNKLGVKVDWVIVDSGKDPQILQELGGLSRSVTRGVIDLQWLALAQLRELIRREFDSEDLRQHLGLIRRVEIDSPTKIDCASPLLMAGWIANCLGADPVRLGPWGIECQRGGEPSLNLSFSPVVLAELQRIQKFGNGGGGIKRDPQERDAATLQATKVSNEGPEGMELRVRFEDSNGAAIANFAFNLEAKPSQKAVLIERYFSLGESVLNYTASARRALEILRLQQAYEVNEIVGEDW